jgi:hypothetical protein
MRRIGLIGSVVLLCGAVFASAETLEIKGADEFMDGYVNYNYPAVWTSGAPYLDIREYWGSNDYDIRPFIRVDLSAIPEGAVIDSASFKLKVHSDTNNSSLIGVDLWQVAPFTADLTPATCDGVNPWPNGEFDGVDGYFRTPADRILATTPINLPLVGSYVEFADARLSDYLQTQSDQAAGERYAYFQMSWNDGDAAYYGAFYSTETSEGDLPYLELGYTIPEPMSLSLMGIGIFGLLRRKH